MRTRQIVHRWGMIAALIIAIAGQIVSAPATIAAQVDVPPATYPPLTYSPELVEAECNFAKNDLPASLKITDNVTCGTVAVPQDHDDPEGDAIDLFVVKVASTHRRRRSSCLLAAPVRRDPTSLACSMMKPGARMRAGLPCSKIAMPI